MHVFQITVLSEYNNANIVQLWPHGYVLKVLNSLDSLKKHVGRWTTATIWRFRL